MGRAPERVEPVTGRTGIYRGLTSYGDPEFSRYLRGAFLASSGFDGDDLSRPVVGVADTSSDFTTCHRQMPELVRAVQRGVLEAGGLPFVFPSMSLAEILLSPTAMLFRNLMAMATEEMILAQPMDAVVLLGGCDKTVPAQLMAAASADVPAIVVVAGPMLTGSWRGSRLGACTDCRLFWSEHRAGRLDQAEIREVEGALCATAGTCMVMGTASTMACVAEALGMMLPGGAAAPAPTGDRLRHAVASGRRAVVLAREGVRPSRILAPAAFRNAMLVLEAVGGSTNAIIHLLAIARRAAVPLTLDDFDRVSREVGVLVDCKPAGSGYMEDFHRAGGVPTLLHALEPLLEGSAPTVGGGTIGEIARKALPPQEWQTTIRPLDEPVHPPGGLAVLRGSLAPDGAVLKTSAASPHLQRHRGPALVLDSAEDAPAVLDDPSLEVTEQHVLIVRRQGPIAAGMPESGAIPIPRRLLEAGVRDMVRVSDGRMSGTAYGTVVLHCSPEAAAGGPLGLVRNGDMVSLDVPERRLELEVEERELARRREAAQPVSIPARGWRRLYAENVLQAHLGADLEPLAPGV
jgi:dihydroxy-acid dehydratase